MSNPAENGKHLVSRQEVEDFLYHEAHLLDDWRLSEWLELLTEDAEYEVPATDSPGSDCRTTLALIYDDRERINARVKQYLDDTVYAEIPRSRVRRIVGNVRILGATADTVDVTGNFIVHRFASEKMDVYVGHFRYALVRKDGGFKIRKRRVMLDLEVLRPQCMLSIII